MTRCRAGIAGRTLGRLGLALVAVAIVASCSSSKAATSAPTTTSTSSTSTSTSTSGPITSGPGIEPSFQARATAICISTGAALRAEGSFPFPNFDPEHPDAAQLPAIATFEAKTVANEQSWQKQLHALGQPNIGAAAWNTFLAAVDSNVVSTVAQQRAAQTGDSAAFTQTFHDLTAQGPGDTKAAVAIGAPICDPDHLGG
jgi:hypothetical protein